MNTHDEHMFHDKDHASADCSACRLAGWLRHPVGTRVYHASYGEGTVVESTGHTHPFYNRVTFDRKSTTLRLPTATLHKIKDA